MKKLISLCGALAIAASAFSSIASAAIKTEALTLNTEVEVLDNQSFNDFYEEDIPEGMAAYLVKFNVGGIEDDLSYTKTGGNNKNPKYSGYAIDSAEVNLTPDYFDKVDQDYSMIYEHALSADPEEGFGAASWGFSYSSTFVYPATPDTAGAENGITSDYVTVLFLVGAEDTVTFDVDANIGISEYTDSVLSGDKEKKFYGVECAPIVLAPAGTEEPEPAADVVVNSGDKYNNGYVWNVTVNKDMEAFGVKFYSGEDTLEKSVKNVDALPKLDGGVGYNFNVGLKTAKTIDQADFTADDATASWKAE